MSQKSSVIYFHPVMKSMADGVHKQCNQMKTLVTKGNILWNTFADTWPNLFIENVHEECVGRDVIFFGSLHTPNVIFEQLSVLYALPKYLCRSVTLVLPYFPTATMDRIDTEGSIATASTMARILSATPLTSRGPCQIIIFDIHALQERFYFGDNVIPRLVSAVPLLLSKLKELEEQNISIVFPDDGAYKRFHGLFEQIYPLIICTKIRDGNKRIVKIKEGETAGQHCVIVDDLVMSGGTLIECAKVLKNCGVDKISAYVTHAVFPQNSWKNFCSENSLFDKFYITDSIPHAVEISQNKPFELLSLSTLLSNILMEYDLMRYK